MKNNKIILLFLFAVLLSGCVIDRYTAIYTSIHNQTSHEISILLYKHGIVGEDDTIKLTSLQSMEIGYGTTKGDIKSPMFIVEKFEQLDSVVVIFDGMYRIVHYTTPPDSLASKYYLITSLRNLDNAESYQLTRGKKRINYCDYYFTEQDYLDAKD